MSTTATRVIAVNAFKRDMKDAFSPFRTAAYDVNTDVSRPKIDVALDAAYRRAEDAALGIYQTAKCSITGQEAAINIPMRTMVDEELVNRGFKPLGR